MDDKLFEERMQKLKTSYKHIPKVTTTEKILNEVKNNEKPIKRRVFFQLPYVASFIGVLIIGGILGIQFFSQTNNLNSGEKSPTGETTKQPITNGEIEAAINETRGYYERELDELKDRLNFEDVEQYGFVQEAKGAVEKFERRKDYASQAELTTYMGRVKEIITLRISMPHEEFELLQKAVDKGETINNSQLFGYIDKLDMLHERFHEQWFELYTDHQHTMTDITTYVHELNEGNIKGDPEYVKLINTLKSNGYSFYHEGEGYINFNPDYMFIHDQLADSLGDDAKLYMKIKSEQQALLDGALAISHKELGERLLEIENFVLNNPTYPKVEEFKEQYRLYIDFYLKGTDNTTIVTNDGKIKDEVKTNLETLISENEYSETAKVVNGFYEKLNDSQFVLSNELRTEKIELPKPLKPQVEEYSIEKHLLPITDKMIAKYEEFKENREMAVFNEPFSGLNSIELSVARMYMYAVEKGDYETAYHLLFNGADSKLPNQEDFIKEMQKSPINFQTLSNEVVKVSTNYENAGEMIEHIFIKENGETVKFQMKLENGFPKVKYQPLS
jgi:hypothetical protein